ncbi:hypothetical protein ACIRBX_29970 [Kitasatospora sp. NPDC096147]|uniref:hypothetical protein n=1 Tax=Kitasatospora sp. NPDC096147 TaxID=3364093 RepID=UPI003823CAE8
MSSGDDTGERNPFAPPPADAPDQPWQPRTPPAGSSDQQGDTDGERGQVPPPHPWSPGHRGNGWGTPPPAPQQPKSDPNDPVQRGSRNALMAGIGGIFCVVLGIPYVALLLGALAAYWGIGALRAPKQRTASEGPAAAGTGTGTGTGTGQQTGRPHAPAAIGGLVTGLVTVLATLALLGTAVYYRDYVSCLDGALTTQAADSCSNLAPDFIVDRYNPAR